ncbi:BRO1 domain-containing protein [Plasmodium brasilianum]|uniref:BRO1 domain-containing protein, putative n=2 Tax=Plasmodium (Plasmodium) TaxID=418103 RepID=A0A1D3TEX6_PLAMA|nr:BRO1 domain-containing protein, putative [Plasmodium malariae]KAI4834954.1 BRO1 domain-containing protein [Plasmodium brasilianum]SCP03525.1 BRO1 domain-containing protein, putative [Plasmodium malariae]
MQVVSDWANLKYLYDKINIGKVIYRNLRELSTNYEYNFDEEIGNFTNLRTRIMVEQYRGMNSNLLRLYKEYLFFFETFKKKKLLKEKKKVLYTNDVFEKNKKVEYAFEQENVLIIYNIGLISTNILKIKKDSEDNIKLLNKMSNEIVDVFNYLFQNMNDEKLEELTDINCISSYIFLCISLAYHENMFYNTAILKKYKRNLLAKLSYNIYTHFNNALTCLDGKIMLDVFKQSSNFYVAKNNLQYIRNTNGNFYNFVQVNQIIFISISNYHMALKYAQLCPHKEEVSVQKYEEDKIAEIICRLKYSLDNINRGVDLCKKYNLNVNIISLREKIIKALEYFEYENQNIYFEIIPSYESLYPIKGTEVIKLKNVDISNLYIKKNISNNLKLLFNDKAKQVYNQYNSEALTLYDFYNKNYLSLNDQYKLINLSCRKNILQTLNNVIINTYNKIKQLYNPTLFDNNLNVLINIDKNLKDILIQTENSLAMEHKNHVEFQKKYVNVGINQESINSYNTFLFHLNNFKKDSEELEKSIQGFTKFLENNYSTLQVCEMDDISNFFRFIVDELNNYTNVNINSLDSEYLFYKNLLSEDREKEKERYSNSASSSVGDIQENPTNTNTPSLNYTDFYNFLKSNNLSFAMQNNINNQTLFHYSTLSKYINVHSEEKLFFVIISIYFSLSIQLAKFEEDLAEIKNSLHDYFLNAITEENDSDKLNEILEKQKGLLNAKKIKLEENVSTFERDLNQFYDYYHEYNKLDNFKAVEDLNKFINELKKNFDKLNEMHKKNSFTLKNSLMLKDDINRYIYMRERERSNIRVQQIPNNYQGNYHNRR